MQKPAFSPLSWMKKKTIMGSSVTQYRFSNLMMLNTYQKIGMHYDIHILICTYWTKKELSGICILMPYFFNFKVALLRKVFSVDTASQEIRRYSKIQKTLLGFNILPTLSPNFTKTDQTPAKNKLSKDQNSSQNTLPEKSDLKFFRASVFVHRNGFPYHACKGC